MKYWFRSCCCIRSTQKNTCKYLKIPISHVHIYWNGSVLCQFHIACQPKQIEILKIELEKKCSEKNVRLTRTKHTYTNTRTCGMQGKESVKNVSCLAKGLPHEIKIIQRHASIAKIERRRETKQKIEVHSSSVVGLWHRRRRRRRCLL